MLKKIGLFLLVPLLIIILANRIFFFKPTFLENTAACIISPTLQVSSAIATPIQNIFTKHYSYKELVSRCEQLAQEQALLTQENIKLKALYHYIEKSKELLAFTQRYQLENALLAKVLVKKFSPEEHSLIVNQGARDGVQKNMVALYKFQLIGRVSQVGQHFSKITLITDSCSKVAAYTNTSEARGIVEGSNVVNRCRLCNISHLTTVQNGDLVLSSGQGLMFPEGFCLGKIVDIKTDDICHFVEVAPLIDFTALEMCLLTNKTKMNLF